MIDFVKDPNTLLLLHGEEFVDSSGNGLSITNNGVAISTSQSKFGGSSFYFNGGAYLTAPGYDFGAEDFTIDWWEYATNANAGTRFTSNFCTTYSTQAGGILLHANESGLKVYASDTTNNNWNLINNQPSGANILNEWVHRAVVRSGNTLMLFVNGTLEYSYTLSGSIGYNSTLPMGIGGWAVDGPGSNYFFTGYIDEFRVSNIARWTASFTPPTEPYADGLIVVTPGGAIPQKCALRRRVMMKGNTNQWTLEVTPYEGSDYRYASVSIGGNTLDAGTYEVDDGTIVHFKARGQLKSAISLDSEQVASATQGGIATYDLEIHANYVAAGYYNSLTRVVGWNITTQQ